MLLPLLVLSFSCVYGHKICFDTYGCFGDEPPFNHPLIQLPQNPDVIQTSFALYTRENLDTPQVLDPLDSSSVNASFFAGEKKTAVIVHGYFRKLGVQFWERPLIEALLRRDDMNVIFLDWTKGSDFPYHQAVGNARIVGAQLTKLMNGLKGEQPVMNLSDFHCIGFGLGSEVCGYLGRNVVRSNRTIGRITALDPPALFFEGEHVDRRLDPTDADFVDAIHTDTNTIIVKGLGTEDPVGHLDFYPNGGYSQPDCRSLQNGIAQLFTCSHFRSAVLFTESINSRHCPNRGYSCPDCPVGTEGCDKYDEMFSKGLCNKCPPEGCPSMGYEAVKHQGLLTGKYYLKTSGSKPFCAYQYFIKFNTGSEMFADLHGAVTVTLIGRDETSEQISIPSHYYKSGGSDFFLITTRFQLGDLLRVQIKHTAWIDMWLLNSVVVRPMWTNIEYTGCYKKWLNNDDNEVKLHTGEAGLCV